MGAPTTLGTAGRVRRGTIKAAVGQAELRLALDGVSGPATGVLAATLSPHHTLVSFPAMSKGPMSIDPLDVIFKPLTMRGFGSATRKLPRKLAQQLSGGSDNRLRLGPHTSARDLPHLLDRTGCRACAIERKDPSRRSRIIYLTSETSIRYRHHDQDQRRRSNGRCRTRWQSPVGPELSESFQVLVNLQSKACSNIKLRRQVTERSRLLVTP